MQWGRWGSRWETTLVCLLLLPLLVWSVMWIAGGWVPQGDEGWIALKTHDVFSAHPPLQGMRSTSNLSWHGVSAHHPGPIEFYLLAVPYAVTGYRPAGLVIGCFLLAAVLVWLAIHHAWAVGRRKGITAVVVAVVGCEILLGPLLVLPWNPWPPVFGSLALVVLAWRLLLRQSSVLPWFVAVCSLVLQANLAFVALLTPLLLVLVCVGLLRWRSRRWRPADAWWRRPGVVATAVGVVLWAPAIAELFLVTPNNASQLWQIVVRVVSSSLHVAALMALLVACVWIARRITSGSETPIRSAARWVSVLIGVGVVAALAAGGFGRALYLVMALAAMIFAVAVWLDQVPVRRYVRAMPPPGWGVVGVVIAVCMGPSGAAALPFTRLETQAVDRSAPVVHDVLDSLHAHGIRGGAVVVRAEGILAVASYQMAVVTRLAAGGYRPYFDTVWPHPEDDAFRRTSNAPPDAVQVTLVDGRPPKVELPRSSTAHRR